MKRVTLFIFINFLSQVANSQENLAKEMLIKSALMLKSKTNFSYKTDYRIKYFDNTDTTINPTYKCYITKAPEDTILKYYANISNWNESRVYNGTDFLLVWHKVKAVTRDVPAENGKRFALNNIRKENGMLPERVDLIKQSLLTLNILKHTKIVFRKCRMAGSNLQLAVILLRHSSRNFI